MRPLVALLTDFGTRDFYVGALKGALLTVCPEATLVDVSHDVPRHDVRSGAFLLAAAQRAFPAGTVFVAVVDPGVGSARRPLAVSAGGALFVGPDNGLFTLLFDEYPDAQARRLANAALFRWRVAPTFHGRDVFAPVAGHLARGLPFDQVGPLVDDPVRLDMGAAREVEPGVWEAAIVHRDHYGNLTTQLRADQLAAVVAQAGGDPTEVVVRCAGQTLPLVEVYAEVGEGEACALIGSAGRLELAVNLGDAGALLRVGCGGIVRIEARRWPE